MNITDKILELIKEKPMLISVIEEKLRVSVTHVIDVGALSFLRKHKLAEITPTNEGGLVKITEKGLHLLNSPNLPEDETTEEWIDQREHEIGDSIRCIICDQLCKNAYGLANHVTKTHKMFFSEYKRHVLVEAENECNEMKQIATKYLKQINVIGYPMSKYKNIRHLLLLLKEGWK